MKRFFVKIFSGVFRWVNVYEVDRRYGGPEEGGWWYNHYDCIDSKLALRFMSNNVKNKMLEQYGYMAHGNIYSMRGGLDVMVCTENRKAECQTRRIPHYE